VSSELVLLYTLNNRFEADLLMDALQKEGVEAILQSFLDTAYDGLFVPQRGWGRILVPKDELARARETVQPLLDDLRSPEIYSDPSEIDPGLWEDLQAAEPEEVCERALVTFDSASSAYRFPFLGWEMVCDPQQQVIEPAGEAPHIKLSFEFYLVVLHYLLEAQAVPVAGRWINEKELPGGTFFFQEKGPHAIPGRPLAEFFGERAELFRRVAEVYQGTQMEAGDLAFRFRVLPRVPLLLIMWEPDEEFGAEVHFRFDETLPRHLHSLDTVLAMTNVVRKTLLRAGKEML
jgi:hypothetical protein